MGVVCLNAVGQNRVMLHCVAPILSLSLVDARVDRAQTTSFFGFVPLMEAQAAELRMLGAWVPTVYNIMDERLCSLTPRFVVLEQVFIRLYRLPSRSSRLPITWFKLYLHSSSKLRSLTLITVKSQ